MSGAVFPFSLPRSQLILGGQKSGKSRRAELLARGWMEGEPGREAVLIATGQPWDDEMRERIARHRRDRAERVPGMTTLEEPLDLAACIARHSTPRHLLVVDCLTLWLTNWMMPVEPSPELAGGWSGQCDDFVAALGEAPGPVILVGNEIGLGVIPMGSQVRAFVDALGGLNQRVARCCETVTLMCAGLPLALKGPQP